MKTFSFFIGLSLIFCCQFGFCIEDLQQTEPSVSETETCVTIFSSPGLTNLTNSWTSEFMNQNPEIKIKAADLTSDFRLSGNELLIVSTDYFANDRNESHWKMEVGMDAVVPVIAASNPMIDKLDKRGITVAELSGILANPVKKNWKSYIEEATASIELVILNQDGIKSIISQLVGQKTEELPVTWVDSSEEMMAALQKNNYAIGISRISDVLDATTHDFYGAVKLLPMDKNRNGRIDYFEQIYTDVKSFTRGVWIGKYPDELCSGIYAVSANKPASQSALEFLKWINSGGQQLLSQNGFAAISSVEKSANMGVIISTPEMVDQTQKSLLSRTWLMVIFAFVAAVLILIGAVRYTRKQKEEDLSNEIDITPAFNENSIQAPRGIYFDKTHTWAFMEQNGMVKVGIDDFLQHITGTITRIRMKESGEKIRRGEKIVTIIRNGKQMEISSPVSGVIREQNQSLLADASMLNKSPYSEGWVYLIEPKNWLKEMQFLFMAGKYKSWLQDEFTRLKDFLAASMKSNTTVYAHVILQDGGELTDHVLAELGPEVWEDFQTNFIDTSK